MRREFTRNPFSKRHRVLATLWMDSSNFNYVENRRNCLNNKFQHLELLFILSAVNLVMSFKDKLNLSWPGNGIVGYPYRSMHYDSGKEDL